MTSDPTDKRAARADRIREFRDRNAEATGARQFRVNLVITTVCFLFGTMTTLMSFVYFSFWSMAGGLLILAAAGLLILSERSRIESVAPEDRPMISREFRWFLAGLVALAAGMLLVVRPW